MRRFVLIPLLFGLLAGVVFAEFGYSEPALPSYASNQPANHFPLEPDARHTQQVHPKQAGVNLFNISQRRQVFSPVLLSPNRQWLAFTEMRYLPANHSVLARAYLAPLPVSPTFGETHPLPEERYIAAAQQAVRDQQDIKQAKQQRRKTSPKRSCRWFRINCTGQLTIPPAPVDSQLTPTNPNTAEVFRSDPAGTAHQAFRSLIPVDWSADGDTLLLKLDEGQLYQGIDVTHTVTVDALTRGVSRYPQVETAVKYYWQQRGIQPTLTDSHWSVVPTGWQPGNSTTIELEAWQYLPHKRVFLGHWQLETTTGHVQIMAETYNPNWPVAANATVVISPG